MSLELEDSIAAKLKQLNERPSINELSNGWISQRGLFYGIPEYKHEEYIEGFRRVLTEEEFKHFYDNWIKVSNKDAMGLEMFAGHNTCKINDGCELTTLQKIGIFTFIIVRDELCPVDSTIVIHGWGEVYRDFVKPIWTRNSRRVEGL